MTTNNIVAEIEAAVGSEFPVITVCGDPEGHFIIYARTGAGFEPPLNEIVNVGAWQYGYASNESQMQEACALVGLPFLPAKRYPAEMAYGRGPRGILFCSPVPDDLPLDLWYADMLIYHKAHSSVEPSFGVVAAVAAVLSASRFPQKARRFAESRRMPLKKFIVQQYKSAISRLEIDQSLDAFPY